jgi:hypothetical protein
LFESWNSDKISSASLDFFEALNFIFL